MSMLKLSIFARRQMCYRRALTVDSVRGVGFRFKRWLESFAIAVSLVIALIMFGSASTPVFAQVGTVLGVPNSLTSSCSHTFYISQSAGSDSNNGTAKGTPWKHNPYMSTFTGTYSHTAGDCFIHKGGDTWLQADLGTGMKLLNAGSTSDYDYYGVDVTWFTGGSWVRPIFNGQHNSNINQLIWVASGDGSGNANVTIDSLELAGQPIQTKAANDTIYVSALANVMVNNVNIHDWEVISTNAGNQDGNFWGGVGDNNPASTAGTILQNSLIHNEEGCFRASITNVSRTSNVATTTFPTIPAIWYSGTPGGVAPKITVNGVADTSFNMGEDFKIATGATSTTFSYPNTGPDVSTESATGTVTSGCGVAVEFFKIIQNNEAHDITTFQLHGGQIIAGNFVHDTFGTYCNCGSTNNTYVDGWDGGMGNSTDNSYTYNNRFVNANNGTGFWYPNPCTFATGVVTRTMYAFNNVAIWMNGHTSNYAIDIDPSANTPTTTCTSGSTVNIYTYNNTIVLDPSDPTGCGRITPRTGTGEITNVYNINNHCIHTAGTDWNYNGPDLANSSTPLTSLTVTNANAATYGYSFVSTTSTHNHAPTSPTCNGHAGSNSCTVANGTSRVSACSSGSPLSPYLCQDSNTNSRPSSAWDIGAYQYVVLPPTNLQLTRSQ